MSRSRILTGTLLLLSCLGGGGRLAAEPGPVQSPSMAATHLGEPASWVPSEQQKLNVALVTQQYFRLTERGEFPAAYALLSKETQKGISLERWSIRRAEFNARTGEAVERSIRNITWSQERGATVPSGALAAVDHTGKFRNADIHCGKLFWQQQADGSFKLLREIENSIDKKAQSQMTAEQLAATRKKIRC